MRYEQTPYFTDLSQYQTLQVVLAVKISADVNTLITASTNFEKETWTDGRVILLEHLIQ